jgi:hypothetical protein
MRMIRQISESLVLPRWPPGTLPAGGLPSPTALGSPAAVCALAIPAGSSQKTKRTNRATRQTAALDAAVCRTPFFRRLDAIFIISPFSRCTGSRCTGGAPAITGSQATLLPGALAEILQLGLVQRRIPGATVRPFLVSQRPVLLLLVAAAEHHDQGTDA